MNELHFNIETCDQKIKHLTKEKIFELIEKYYQGVPVKNLIAEFSVPISYSRIIDVFPIMQSKTDTCIFCSTALSIIWQSRSKKPGIVKMEKCSACGHILGELCACGHCLEAIRAKEQEKKIEKMAIISNIYFSRKKNPFFYEKLSLKDKLYLGTLLRLALSEDNKTIQPIHSILEKFAPTATYAEKILHHLYEERIVIFSLQNNPDHFNVIGNHIQSFKSFDVKWELNLASHYFSDAQGIIQSLLRPAYLSQEELEEATALWLEVALNECIGQVHWLLGEYHWPSYPFADKTYHAFYYVFEKFSTAQTFYLLSQVFKNLADFKQRKNIPSYMIVKMLPKFLIEQADRYLSNSWSIKERQRYKNQQSAISKFFYDSLIKIGDKSFNLVPSNESIVAYCNITD